MQETGWAGGIGVSFITHAHRLADGKATGMLHVQPPPTRLPVKGFHVSVSERLYLWLSVAVLVYLYLCVRAHSSRLHTTWQAAAATAAAVVAGLVWLRLLLPPVTAGWLSSVHLSSHSFARRPLAGSAARPRRLPAKVSHPGYIVPESD